MRVLGIALLALSPAFALAAEEGGAAPDPLAAMVLERLGEAEKPACVAVALVAEKTRFAYGCTHDAGPLALDRDSLFEIGSITKAFTGLVLADMALKGEVVLGQPAAKYSRPAAKLPTRGGKEITLLDLATQTSGLPRLPPGMGPANPANPYADFDADALYASLARTELVADIGSRYLYSNFGFMWLSEMLSRVGEGSYESVLKRRVLQPLGMHDTAVTLDEGQRKRFLDGHDGSWHVVPHWDNAADLAGVGGLRSSIADMARFAEAMAGRSRTPLEQAIDLATKPQRSAQGVISLGLAWHVSDRGSARVAWHNGGTAGFRSMIAVDRQNGRAAVVLVDGQGQFDDLAMHLVDDSYALHRKRVAIAFDPRKLEDYVGRYEISSTFSIRMFVQDGRLMTQGTNQPAFELFAEAPDRFFARIVDAQVAFRRNADGKVEALTLFQAGREVPAPRVSNTP